MYNIKKKSPEKTNKFLNTLNYKLQENTKNVKISDKKSSDINLGKYSLKRLLPL